MGENTPTTMNWQTIWLWIVTFDPVKVPFTSNWHPLLVFDLKWTETYTFYLKYLIYHSIIEKIKKEIAGLKEWPNHRQGYGDGMVTPKVISRVSKPPLNLRDGLAIVFGILGVDQTNPHCGGGSWTTPRVVFCGWPNHSLNPRR